MGKGVTYLGVTELCEVESKVEVLDASPGVMSHPLLDELKGHCCKFLRVCFGQGRTLICDFPSAGLIGRLKAASQPIQDGHSHLVPFCETLELIFRNGLKRKARGAFSVDCSVRGITKFRVQNPTPGSG